MKKNYFIAILALVCQFAIAQVQQTSYRGAFAPAPTAMWTDGWANFDPNNKSYGEVTTPVSADITSNVTWTKDKVYELTRLITVRNNATLTIQAGTVIRSNAQASALVITRGAKLIANGTLTDPIVFTSKNNAGSRQRGDWGGIVMLGKARYNTNNGVNYIEGLTQSVLTEFGGGTSPIDNDNSGSLKYVRIEFAGYVFAPNNELNGLTMGAVGSGTTIDYVQVSYSNDDSFEWFGGSVNCKHLVAFNGLDDDFDVDSGFKGIVQFGLSIKDPLAADISTSEAFEVDNNAGGSDTTVLQSYGDFTSAVFTNITCIGPNARPNGLGGFVSPNGLHDKALRLRRASQPKIFNSIFLDHKKGLVIESLSSNAAAIADNLKFKNNLIVSPIAFKSDGSGNTTTTSTPTTAQVLAWFNASGNTTYTTNTGLLTRPYDLTSATNYKTITDNTDEVNIDYRPVQFSDAYTGASFTDASLSGLIAVGNAPAVTPAVTYCKGEVATALNATMTETGVSLRWYTTFTTTTVDGQIIKTPKLTVFTTTAPVPATTTVGTKSYWVAEVNASGAVSGTAKIDVMTAAAPLIALGTITGTTAVGHAVGTATEITYTVPASEEYSVVDYLWTVPLGANIVSGQGTNEIVVNYNNVPAGLLKIGNITVQARNGAFCGGVAKTLAITAVLPAAPAAIKMTDALLPLKNVTVGGVTTPTAVALTSFAPYMGQATELTLTATPVAAASSYVWELPTGVNLLNLGAVTSTDQQFYSLYPFTVPVTTVVNGIATTTPLRPTTAGNVYYEINRTTYANGTTITTGKMIRIARPANGSLPAITAFNLTLANQNIEGVTTNKTNEGVTINPAYPIVSSTSNAITVNFADVTSANTFNYNTTAATPVSTNVLRIGVKSRNGVGVSVTANATAVNPTTPSTAKLLTLTAVRPAAVSTVSGQITGLCGNGSYNYTMVASPLASSYEITAPAGSVVTSANHLSNATNVLTTSDLTFTVVYPSAFTINTLTATADKSLVIKSINGINSSATNKTVTLATAMGVPVSANGTFTRSATQSFTVPAVVGATEYVWAVADGAQIVSGQGTTTVVVDFAAVSVLKTTNTLKVSAKNACGVLSSAKSILLTTPAPAARLVAQDEVAVSATEVYPNPASSEFNIDVTGANGDSVTVSVYSYDGSVVVNPFTVQLVEGSNTINQNIASLRSGIYFVRVVNNANNEVIVKKLIKG